jgi:hypothetical protein
VNNGVHEKPKKGCCMISMMIEYGINLMVQSTILFTKEGNYGCILNVDWFRRITFDFHKKGLIASFS